MPTFRESERGTPDTGHMVTAAEPASAAVVLYFGAFLPRFQPFAAPMEKPQGVLACSLKAFSTMARYKR